MTTEEVVTFIREKAQRQQDFVGPAYTQISEADRQAYRHAAMILRYVAEELERKFKEVRK